MLSGPERVGCDRNRGHRVQPGGLEPDLLHQEQTEPAHGQSGQTADRKTLDQQHGHLPGTLVRFLNPGDESDYQDHRDRIVETGLPFQSRRDPPSQGRASKYREDGRSIGRCDDRPEEKPFQERQVEQPGRGRPRDQRSSESADGGQRKGGAHDRPDRRKAGRESALEQDQDQGDYADLLRQFEIGKIDQPQAIASDRHADTDEDDQGGHPDAVRQQGEGQSPDHEEPGNKNVRGAGDALILTAARDFRAG